MNHFSERGRFEQYRLMVISAWPDSDLKVAALVSARAALQREESVMGLGVGNEPVVPRRVAA